MDFMRVQKYSPWHDVESLTDSEHYVNAIVEIPRGTQEKFEVSTKEDWNSIKQDLVEDGSLRKLRYDGKGDPKNPFDFNGMPFAYGMIPRTFEDPIRKMEVITTRIGQRVEDRMVIGGDRDPLDIYILSDRELPVGLCKCKVIGIIHFVDGDEIDYKIIAVDSAYADVDNIKELGDLKNTLIF